MPTVLITGANRGFGYELTKLYADDGWRVLACCRNPGSAEALQAIAAGSDGRVELHQLDVTDHDRVATLAAELKGTPIDVLINNAGILGKHTMEEGALADQAFGNSDAEEWRLLFDTNTLAPMKVAEAFADHVAASEQKKLVTVTSIIGSIAANDFGGLYAYRASKAAANAIMKSMSMDLAQKGIIAFPIHPGYARTDMSGPGADIEPIEGARGMYKAIGKATAEQAGHFLSYEGGELPW